MAHLNVVVPMLVAALSILPAACAPQPTGMAAPPSMTSLSGPANPGDGTSPMQSMPSMDHSSMPGMTGMDRSGAQGMDMNTMMAHCSQMRQQMRDHMTVSLDMTRMMSQCDQMDRSMGAPPGR
jgi:hypothetical protein